jgi:hypothetical protein
VVRMKTGESVPAIRSSVCSGFWRGPRAEGVGFAIGILRCVGRKSRTQSTQQSVVQQTSAYCPYWSIRRSQPPAQEATLLIAGSLQNDARASASSAALVSSRRTRRLLPLRPESFLSDESDASVSVKHAGSSTSDENTSIAPAGCNFYPVCSIGRTSATKNQPPRRVAFQDL